MGSSMQLFVILIKDAIINYNLYIGGFQWKRVREDEKIRQREHIEAI